VTRLSRFLLAASLSAATVALPHVAHGADPTVYVVDDGDSLFAIARRFDVGLGDLLRANGLSLMSIIHPGQRLTIPGASSTSSGGGGSASGGAGYTVRTGDALSTIASRHGVRLADLLRANGISVTTVIHPGQRLTIPGASSTGSGGGGSASGGAGYTVRTGDALSTIASRHGVRLADLLRANGISVTTVIHPGQRLTIPGGSSTSSGGGGSASGGAGYTVRTGDSLSAIASTHGVRLTDLLGANGLTVNSVIQPGQQLTLPAGAISRTNPIDRVVAYALAQVGKPYRFFSKGPYAFDCSGLTLAAYDQIGVSLVHHSATQARQGVPVDFVNQPIRAGDLVFIATNGSPRINHVGIAVSSTRWVQARRPGIPVQLTAMPPASAILAVRRFVNPG
jgi:LysM repeat protein